MKKKVLLMSLIVAVSLSLPVCAEETNFSMQQPVSGQQTQGTMFNGNSQGFTQSFNQGVKPGIFNGDKTFNQKGEQLGMFNRPSGFNQRAPKEGIFKGGPKDFKGFRAPMIQQGPPMRPPKTGLLSFGRYARPFETPDCNGNRGLDFLGHGAQRGDFRQFQNRQF